MEGDLKMHYSLGICARRTGITSFGPGSLSILGVLLALPSLAVLCIILFLQLILFNLFSKKQKRCTTRSLQRELGAPLPSSSVYELTSETTLHDVVHWVLI
jgi:hypothetical protein